LSGTAGGEIGKDGFKLKASADVMNVKIDGIQVRAGVNLDTGISADKDKGLEVKAAGFGFSVDDNHVGFSTPFGEIKFNI